MSEMVKMNALMSIAIIKMFQVPGKKSFVTSKRYINFHFDMPIVTEAINRMWSISSNKLKKDEYELYDEQVKMKMRKITRPMFGLKCHLQQCIII